MFDRKPPDWKGIYQEALAETDQGKLMTKISAAEFVLFSRLQQMHHEPTHMDEASAIYDAVHSLRLLRCDLYSRTKQSELKQMLKRSA